MTERLIHAASGNSSTIGQAGYVKLSYWDYLDCKLVNYLSFGTCIYNPTDIFVAIISLFFSGSGFIAGIVLVIYVLMISVMIVRIFQVYALSFFTICILVLISPIFILFSLFEKTKNIFDNWLKALLGYLLYPPLLTIFFLLAFFTLDSIYYGDVEGKTPLKDSTGAPLYAVNLDGTQDRLAPCSGVNNSAFCYMARVFEPVANSGKPGNLCLFNNSGNPNKSISAMLWGQTLSLSSVKSSILNPNINIVQTSKQFINTEIFGIAGKMVLTAIIFLMIADMFLGFIAKILNIQEFSKSTGIRNLGSSLITG